jgi:phosphoglycerate dehydrogenase-like enzyme
LIEHPLVVTNLRGMFNEHIAAHVLAFVLAFARGLHRYLPQQLHREWKPAPQNEGMVYLPDSTALIVGVGGIGAETARLCAAFGLTVIGVGAPTVRTASLHSTRPISWMPSCRSRTLSS